jgi:hypothetical protein
MRAQAGIPIVLGVASLVLVLFAVLAGRIPGFMEDCHIVLFNTSALGRNMIPTAATGADTSPSVCGSLGSMAGGLCASATAAVETAVGSGMAALSDIENNVADQLAKELGIKQWYSLHILDVCEGTFTPNATIAKAGYNVTGCTSPLKTGTSLNSQRSSDADWLQPNLMSRVSWTKSSRSGRST